MKRKPSPTLMQCLFAGFLGLAGATAHAATTVLYDPSLPGSANDNPTGGAVVWLSGVVPASTTYSDLGASIMQSTSADTAGYSNYSPLLALSANAPMVNSAFPTLSSGTGYRLTFGLELKSEDHSGNINRAGFSVTLIGDDKTGVEIGFQKDSPTAGTIFVQNDGRNGSVIFTRGESVSTALPLSRNLWNLDVHGNTFELALAAGGNPVLSGALRDYSGYTGNGKNAYGTPNFLFLGDNTSSARADFVLSYAAITTPVPEPSTYMMLLAGLGCISLTSYRRRTVRA
jgi:hypothetical protein